MRTVTITCDRCGRPAQETVGIRWEGVGSHLPAPATYDMASHDLCADCARELREWLQGKGGGHASA